MYSYGPPHMAVQKQDDQHEHTFWRSETRQESRRTNTKEKEKSNCCQFFSLLSFAIKNISNVTRKVYFYPRTGFYFARVKTGQVGTWSPYLDLPQYLVSYFILRVSVLCKLWSWRRGLLWLWFIVCIVGKFWGL